MPVFKRYIAKPVIALYQSDDKRLLCKHWRIGVYKLRINNLKYHALQEIKTQSFRLNKWTDKETTGKT
jgi:hypothetical protein